jgi:hypothetical protein
VYSSPQHDSNLKRIKFLARPEIRANCIQCLVEKYKGFEKWKKGICKHLLIQNPNIGVECWGPDASLDTKISRID